MTSCDEPRMAPLLVVSWTLLQPPMPTAAEGVAIQRVCNLLKSQLMRSPAPPAVLLQWPHEREQGSGGFMEGSRRKVRLEPLGGE